MDLREVKDLEFMKVKRRDWGFGTLLMHFKNFMD